MPKKIQVRIDNPCHENWDRMAPKEQGRFCSSCQKMVIDFTGMSDQDVLHWFARPHEGSCGRFRQSQLDHALVPRPERKNSWRGWWHYLLAGLLLSSEVSAQTRPAAPPVSQQDSIRTDSTRPDNLVMLGKISAAKPRHSREESLPDTLRGRLVDYVTGQPIPGAIIKTGHHREEYRADSAGYFALPRKTLSGQHHLTISSIGYTPSIIDVRKTWTDAKDNVVPIRLTEYTTTGLYEIVIKKPSDPMQ